MNGSSGSRAMACVLGVDLYLWGLKAATALLVSPVRLVGPTIVWDGWLVLDRVIDVSGYQTTLTWDIRVGQLKGGFILSNSVPQPSQVCFLYKHACGDRRMWITCRWLILFAFNHLRIRHDCEAFYAAGCR